VRSDVNDARQSGRLYKAHCNGSSSLRKLVCDEWRSDVENTGGAMAAAPQRPGQIMYAIINITSPCGPRAQLPAVMPEARRFHTIAPFASRMANWIELRQPRIPPRLCPSLLSARLFIILYRLMNSLADWA
jgi:hypothetical protein